LSLSEIAGAVNIPPSTAHRMIGALCAQGLLRRSPWRTYAIGPRLKDLAVVIARDGAA
jgi:DNA-binding IclR family transcriptional regulator